MPVRRILLALLVAAALVLVPTAVAGASGITVRDNSVTTALDTVQTATTSSLVTAPSTSSASDAATVDGTGPKCPNPGGHTPPPCNGDPSGGPKCPNPGGH